MAAAHFDHTDGATGFERNRPGFPLTHCNNEWDRAASRGPGMSSQSVAPLVSVH
jgi:hypothetical protein